MSRDINGSKLIIQQHVFHVITIANNAMKMEHAVLAYLLITCKINTVNHVFLHVFTVNLHKTVLFVRMGIM